MNTGDFAMLPFIAMGFELHPDRVQALAETLPTCQIHFAEDIEDFCVLLLNLNQHL